MKISLALAVFVSMAALSCATKAASLTVESSALVTFDTVTNRFYQVEMASSIAPDQWTPVGPTHWGRGKPLSQAVVVSPSSQLFFRAREFDLTNQLHAYFPLDGGRPRSESGFGQEIYATYFIASRFGTPNHAGSNRGDATGPYGPYAVSASVQRFAQGGDDFTISVWVMATFDDPSSNRFGHILSMGGGSGAGLWISDTNNTIQLHFGKLARDRVPVTTSAAVTWESNRWYCIQLVRSQLTYFVYRDGELMGQGAPSKPAAFWDYFSVAFGPERGGVDEIRFYNRALSIEELGALYRLAEH